MKPCPPLRLSFADTDQPNTSLTVQFGFGPDLSERARFQSDGAPLRRSGDVLFCLGLLPAMEIGADLVLAEPVDGGLLDNADLIQDLIRSWYPWCSRVKVTADRCATVYPERQRTGLFFSGGVDSSYSLATERDRLDVLVTLIGLDRRMRTASQAAKQRANLARAAGHFRLEGISIETDIRDVSDPLIGWVEYHGSLLAAVRHMLADHVSNQIIASSDFEVNAGRPWGSHPQLDRLFATAGAGIEHHGLTTRFSKIRRIACDPALVDHLAVCNYSEQNCGRCSKCLFVMNVLDVAGPGAGSAAFPPLASRPAKFRIVDESVKVDLIELKRVALARGDRAGLVAAVDAALRRYRLREAFGRLPLFGDLKLRFKHWKRRRRYLAKVAATARDRRREP